MNEMSFFRRIFATSDDWVLTLARLMLGVVFFAHGAQKVLGWFGGPGFSATMGMFHHMGVPGSLALLAICAEFFGGLGLIVGLLGRVAAFGIAVDMLVAVLLVHSRIGFFMNWAGRQGGEGFEFHLLAIGLACVIVAKGSGALSIDRLIGRTEQALPERLAA
jgi:putative oxidoreductase